MGGQGLNMSLDDLDTDTLVDTWLAQAQVKAFAEREMGHIEMELTHRMVANGATAIPHPAATVTFEGGQAWDKSKLYPLRELVSPEDLDGAYMPEHEETVVVAESWNMTKVKPLAKFGREVAEAIESARVPTAPRLKIKPRG